MEKKAQHVIPNCYLKAWCAPESLNKPDVNPYIWRISKDGSKRIKKSPENSFISNDHYTIKLPTGDRELVVEDTLAQLENKFVQIIPKIQKQENLTDEDRANLILFTAAMHSRTKGMGEWFKKTQTELHEAIVAMEKLHNSPPKMSQASQKYIDHANPIAVAMLMKAEAPVMARMEMAILVTDDPIGFITSDEPCLWFNPEAYKWPPFYRSPGLAQENIEVSLPLTPQHMLLISHKKYELYVKVPQIAVDEGNRLRRFSADQEFVSWTGETKPYWFKKLELPNDAWENTEEGKRASAEKSADSGDDAK